MPLCFQRSVLMYRLRECLTGFMVSLCILPPGPALYRQMVQKWFCCLSVPIIHPFSLHHEPEHCQPLTLVSISFYFQINFDKFTSVGFFFCCCFCFCFFFLCFNSLKEYKILDHISMAYSLFTRIFLSSSFIPSIIGKWQLRWDTGQVQGCKDACPWTQSLGNRGKSIGSYREISLDHMRLLSRIK